MDNVQKRNICTVNYIEEGADTSCPADITDVLVLLFIKGKRQSFCIFQRASLMRNESTNFYNMLVICTFCILLRSKCFFV
jgi:hypothetical protein